MIKRDRYLNKIIDYMWDGQIKVVTGIRRSGKSVLLFKIFYNYLIESGIPKENIITIQLDKQKNIQFRNPLTLASYVEKQISHKKNKFFLLIDEIQFCNAVTFDNSNIKTTIYDLLNELKDYDNLDVYVTGSNSKMLSNDILTEFRGRASKISIFPLSFSEYYNYIGGSKIDAFNKYMIYGGMPYLTKLKNETQYIDYLQSLFNEVYIKDIIERNNIKKTDILEDLLNVLSSQTSCLTNPLNISNFLKSIKKTNVSSNTIKKYINYCKDAFLINEAKRYDVKGKHYFDYPNKYYYIDIGLRNARLNFRQFDVGHIMENIIYNELISRGYSVDIGVVFDRHNGTNKQKEIDFVVNLGDKRIYIQSAWQTNNENKANAELNSLKLTNDFFAKIIIQSDIPHSFSDDNGIIHLNIFDFLLNEKRIDKIFI